MASLVRYQYPSRHAWTRIATNPTLTASLEVVGAQAKAIAEGLAADFAQTGRYAAAFALSTGVESFSGHTRSAVTLSNSMPYSAEVELRHAVLARTLGLLHLT